MKKKYIIAHISDIHIGALKADKTLYQLTKMYLNKLDKLDKLDVIFLAGDLFHTRILVNSKHFECFLLFFTRLLEIAEEKGSKIRIIKGTDGHDYKQLEYIKPLIHEKKVDCKIFNTVDKEDLFEDMRVLYIPEEYMENKDEYYKDYKNGLYDIIVMHGVVTETAFKASSQESEITMAKAPILDTSTLMKLCRGPILAGHIHTRTEIKKAIYYPGSFLRWSFGEEEDKGWNLVEYENGEYTVTFIKNELADEFISIPISVKGSHVDIPTFIDDISKQFEHLDGNGIMYRIIFNIPDDYEKPDLLIKTINEFFSRKENIKVLIKNNSKLKEKAKTDEKLQILYDKYNDVLRKDNTLEEKIQAFVKIKFGKDISLNKIDEYLYKPINFLDGGDTNANV